jgi:hypothetical protein
MEVPASIAGQLSVPRRHTVRELGSAKARTKTFGSMRSRYLEKAQTSPLKLFEKT